jgi:hypothetical protein
MTGGYGAQAPLVRRLGAIPVRPPRNHLILSGGSLLGTKGHTFSASLWSLTAGTFVARIRVCYYLVAVFQPSEYPAWQPCKRRLTLFVEMLGGL